MSVDTRYILARDNYTCQSCSKEITEMSAKYYGVPPEDNNPSFSGDNNPSDVRAVCNECFQKPLNLVPHKTSYTGRLIVITGPMFASKSTVTRSLYNKYKVFNPRCVWVKPHVDDRTEGFTKTHDEEQYRALTIRSDRPDKSIKDLLLYDVIAIDEAQFFSDRLLYTIHTLLRKNKLIIVNGLRLTAQRGIFGIMHYLMAEADDIISLKAVCSRCRVIDTATRTKSYKKLPSVQTGGADAYYAICPLCDGDL